MAIDLSIESIQWGLIWSSTFDGIQTPDPQSCCAKQLPKSKLSLTVLWCAPWDDTFWTAKWGFPWGKPNSWIVYNGTSWTSFEIWMIRGYPHDLRNLQICPLHRPWWVNLSQTDHQGLVWYTAAGAAIWQSTGTMKKQLRHRNDVSKGTTLVGRPTSSYWNTCHSLHPSLEHQPAWEAGRWSANYEPTW